MSAYVTEVNFFHSLFQIINHCLFQVFDGVIEFLISTVERTYTERVRGEARRKWLAQIQTAAETGGASMDSVYRAVFQTLYKVIFSDVFLQHFSIIFDMIEDFGAF